MLIRVRPLTPYPAERYRHGARLILSTIRQNSASPLPRHKTLNYLPYLLARQEAADAKADGALLLNEHGQVAEESVSNIFFARDDALVTPPVHCGLLPGIMRATVIVLARDSGIDVKEDVVPAGELFAYDEAFLTNSLMEIMPVRAVDKRNIGETTPGSVTQRFQELLKTLIAKECSG